MEVRAPRPGAGSPPSVAPCSPPRPRALHRPSCTLQALAAGRVLSAPVLTPAGDYKGFFEVGDILKAIIQGGRTGGPRCRKPEQTPSAALCAADAGAAALTDPPPSPTNP